MSDIIKCPMCGKEPYVYYNRIICCGLTIRGDNFVEHWNRYAAAMELARAWDQNRQFGYEVVKDINDKVQNVLRVFKDVK